MNITNTLSRLIGNNHKIGVAVSGGVDSMVLLTILCDYAKTNRTLTISAINVEHGIRGDESISDSLFVANFCDKEKIKLYNKEVDAPMIAKTRKMTLEEGARFARYEFFEELIAKNEVEIIATAHHMGDQLETILMRLERGVGVKGLIGIKEKNNNYIRPLLECEKEDIINFAREGGVPYVTDSTNLDTRYTRNFYRNDIIPYLTRENITLSETLKQRLDCEKLQKNRYLIMQNEDNDFNSTENNVCDIFSKKNSKKNMLIERIKNISSLAKKLTEFAEKAADRVFFEKGAAYIERDILEICDFGAKEALDKAFSMFGVKKDVEARHLREIKALASRENGTSINLPFRLTAYREYDYVTITTKICRQKSVAIPKEKLIDRLKLGENNGIISTKIEELSDKIVINSTLQRIISLERQRVKDDTLENLEKQRRFFECTAKELIFDISKLPKNITLRSRREGDIFQNVGGAEKLLSDFLQEKKFPQRLRDGLQLICFGKRVLLIVGVAVSQQLKTDDKTERAIHLKCLFK